MQVVNGTSGELNGLFSTMTSFSDKFTTSHSSLENQTDDVTTFSATSGGYSLTNTTLFQPSVDDSAAQELPVIGLPGPLFTIIHAAALCSLSTTVIVSSSLIIYLCAFQKSAESSDPAHPAAKKDGGKYSVDGSTKSTEMSVSVVGSGVLQSAADKKLGRNTVNPAAVRGKKTRKSFLSWNIGERLVIYLAICDLFLGTSHILDHSYMLATEENPPDDICRPMAFFLLSSTLAQWFVVIFSAVSASSLVVFGKKLNPGRYDWRLLLGTFGLAFILSGLSWIFDVLGPTGAWCCFDLRTSRGRLASTVFSFVQICAFAVVTFAYGAIWLKIQQTARLMSADDSRYRNSARVMMVFIAVFIFQWWPLTVFFVWAFIGPPSVGILITLVVVVNFSGVYNCVAYTVIRRRLKQQAATRKPQVVLSHGDRSAI